MDVRTSTNPWLRRCVDTLERFNARHPWSHNDHFHPWILRNLPADRGLAVDVGCGQGLLLSRLSPQFDRVLGTDADAAMRADASRTTAPLSNVTVSDAPLPGLLDLAGPADLVTMVAVLHHLDVPDALAQVRDLLAPGGRFLAVGLAAPGSARDLAWDLASAVTNPLIGVLKHPRPAAARRPDPYPVVDPTMTLDQLAAVLTRVMHGASLRHRLAFRHTISWLKPGRS